MALVQNETGLPSPSADTVYQALGNQRRRYVLYLLVNQQEPMDIGTLAKRIAALENNQSVRDVSYEHRKSVYTGLHQNHLPLMEQAGLIRSEQGWGCIELTDRGSEIGRQLARKTDHQIRRYFLFLGVAAFGIGLIVGVLLSLSLL